MRKVFVQSARIAIGLIYFVFGFFFLMGIVDTRVVRGLQPGFMAADLKNDAKYSLQFALRAVKASRSKNPYDLRTNGLRPVGMRAVVGINPKCLPDVPVNTLDAFLNRQRFTDYIPAFTYDQNYLDEFQRQTRYSSFFSRMPCPKEGELQMYSAIIGEKYGALWSFFFKMDGSGVPIAIYEDGTPIESQATWLVVLGLIGVAALVWFNRRIFRGRRLGFIEYPNYILIIVLVHSIILGLANLKYWSKIE